jgi:hypothetical protein
MAVAASTLEDTTTGQWWSVLTFNRNKHFCLITFDSVVLYRHGQT